MVGIYHSKTCVFAFAISKKRSNTRQLWATLHKRTHLSICGEERASLQSSSYLKHIYKLETPCVLTHTLDNKGSGKELITATSILGILSLRWEIIGISYLSQRYFKRFYRGAVPASLFSCPRSKLNCRGKHPRRHLRQFRLKSRRFDQMIRSLSLERPVELDNW